MYLKSNRLLFVFVVLILINTMTIAQTPDATVEAVPVATVDVVPPEDTPAENDSLITEQNASIISLTILASIGMIGLLIKSLQAGETVDPVKLVEAIAKLPGVQQAGQVVVNRATYEADAAFNKLDPETQAMLNTLREALDPENPTDFSLLPWGFWETLRKVTDGVPNINVIVPGMPDFDSGYDEAWTPPEGATGKIGRAHV